GLPVHASEHAFTGDGDPRAHNFSCPHRRQAIVVTRTGSPATSYHRTSPRPLAVSPLSVASAPPLLAPRRAKPCAFGTGERDACVPFGTVTRRPTLGTWRWAPAPVRTRTDNAVVRELDETVARARLAAA